MLLAKSSIPEVVGDEDFNGRYTRMGGADSDISNVLHQFNDVTIPEGSSALQ
jgi:hypothetical protein